MMNKRSTRSLHNVIIPMLLSIGLTAHAQLSITGNIVDSTGTHLAFAGIKLSADEGRTVKRAISDSMGSFAFAGLPRGNYTLTVGYFGADLFSTRFRLTEDTVLQVQVRVTESTLKDIVVTATKPLLERKVDRTVFNVANSVAAKGADLATALGLAPMLKLSEDGISIVGKGSVSVMINERVLRLNGSDLINYLKSLRADEVEKIEIITTPPARYEAQGNSGLINIVLKTNPSQGLGGSISTSYAQRMYAGFGSNANLNFQSAGISASLKLRQYDRRGLILEDNDIVGSGYAIMSEDPRRTRSTGIGGNASIEFRISKKSTIGLVYDEGSSNYKVKLENRTTYQRNNTKDSILSTSSDNKNPVATRTVTFYFDRKLKGSGNKLSADLNYFSNEPVNDINFVTSSDRSSATQAVRTYSGIRYQIWSAQSDLNLSPKWAMLETGVKFTNFNNNSDVRYSNLIAQQYVIDNSKSNLFDYNEKNMAGYVSVQKTIDESWTGKAGLRYEYSVIDGYSPTTGSHSRSNYGNLFPTAYLTYKPGPFHSFSISYSRRIDRPNFRAINPFRYYTNPYTYSTGNPLLQPALTNNVEISWLFKNTYSVTVYAQHLVNGYGYVTQVTGAYRVVDAKNYLTQRSAGITASGTIRFFNWWESNNHLTFSLSASSSSSPEFVTQKGSVINWATNHTLHISKKFSAFVNYNQTLPATQSNSYRATQFDIAAGTRIMAIDNRLQFTASVALGAIDRSELYFRDYTQYIRTDYNYRTANFSMTYIFGRTKVKGNIKKVNFTETQRAN